MSMFTSDLFKFTHCERQIYGILWNCLEKSVNYWPCEM